MQPKVNEPVLDAAALERQEREQLRREQEAEFEQALMEDKVTIATASVVPPRNRR